MYLLQYTYACNTISQKPTYDLNELESLYHTSMSGPFDHLANERTISPTLPIAR